MKKLFLWALITFITSVNALADLTTPVQNDPDTIGLWNFDSDSMTTVNDLATDPINGTANEAEVISMPEQSAVFLNSRRFYQSNSIIDLGVVSGSKLDLQASFEFSFEANVRLESPASANHVIWESNQLHVVVYNGKLGAFVRQPSGLVGLYYNNDLVVGTNYNVMIVWKNRRLTIFINSLAVDSVVLDNEVSPVSQVSAHAFIGGNIYGQFFPGYIDDVRLSKISRIENNPPVLTILSPDLVNPLDDVRPEFNIQISDPSGIEEGRVQILLNGVVQNSLVVTQTSIMGYLENDLKRDRINVLEIKVFDIYGNEAYQKYNIVMEARTGKGEYEGDTDTLLLYHFNDYDTLMISDDSGLLNNAFIDDAHNRDNIANVLGVFSMAKQFTNVMYLAAPTKIRTHQFTFETWMNPSDDQNASIFSNGDITVNRKGTGYIEIRLETVQQSYTFLSNLDFFKRNETHHLAITWDGTKEIDNLKFYVDGVLYQTFDAPTYCDFKNVPQLTSISSFDYSGMLDEMRLSNVVRDGFNIPTLSTGPIAFDNLKIASSVNTLFPEVDVKFYSLSPVVLSKVKMYLNGVDQTSSPGLVITSAGITGLMADAVKLGHNTIKVEFEDEDSNYRSLNSWFLYIRDNGGIPYEVDSDTLLYWDFNSDVASTIVDLSSYNRQLKDHYAGDVVLGSRGNGRTNLHLQTYREIKLTNRSFTVEASIKRRFISYPVTVFAMNSIDSSLNILLNNVTGTLNFTLVNKGVFLTGDVPVEIPEDGNYHHLAFVYDHASKYSQVKMIIDGKISYSKNFNCYCQFSNPFDIQLNNQSNIFDVDEVRIVNRAVYDFNIGSSTMPELSLFSIQDGDDLDSQNPIVTFKANDLIGVDTSNVSLFLNGAKISTYNFQELGGQVQFEMNLENIKLGPNELKVVLRNSLGNANIKIINFNGI